MGGSVVRPFAVRRACDSGARLACAAALSWLASLPDAHAQVPCAPVLAHVVSIQGKVEIRRADAQWVGVERNAPLCRGDTIRVHQYGRAALQLSNETMLRLDQGTTLTLAPPDTGKATLIEQLSGGLHVITRTPRAFSVKTPFINANIEGTEFAVRTTDDGAAVVVFEGVVQASNAAGSATLAPGEQATVSGAKSVPVKSIVVRPLDAVAWTLYFPALFDGRSTRLEAGASPALRESLARYREGDFSQALVALGADAQEPAALATLIYRAGLLLLVGRVEEARRALDAALRRDPANSDAHALEAVIAVVENDNPRAIELATRAVDEDPQSPAALIALSYAQQARFDLEAALVSARRAVGLDPSSALAHARSAELEMSAGRLNAALAAAQQAVALDPDLGRTQTVLGFANLIRIDTRAARASFERAIELDQADPLPRLGLGLAKVRDGDLEAGRVELEIAAILDPGNSLVRSYLGKAYSEEGRDRLAGEQFGIAKRLDPRDPTPYLYDAVRKQVQNRPVEALEDIDRSIDLNDNRAVYRSRLRLDEDSATRRISLARTYLDVGFDRLAVDEAAKSLAADSANSSAHRFLADYYLTSPRHDMARNSELLQSQLLQPLNNSPAQPRLSVQGLAFVDQSLFISLGANEYSQLMTKKGLSLYADAGAGSWNSYATSVALSGLGESAAFSLGYFALGSDGFRENNDRKYSTANAFIQIAATPDTSVQAELRRIDKRTGDTTLTFFDAENFNPSQREQLTSTAGRLGLRHNFSPASVLLASYVYRRQDDTLDAPDFELTARERESVQMAELRQIYQGTHYSLTGGFGVVGGTSTQSLETPFDPVSTSDARIREFNAYAYYTGNVAPGLDVTAGLSFDSYEDADTRRQVWNPKLGVLWSPTPQTTLRLAAFRAFKRRVVSDQTLEPTTIVGFNQFFSGINDLNGTESELVGAAVAHRLDHRLSVGSEISTRRIRIEGSQIAVPEDVRVRETLWNTFLYWTPSSTSSISVGFQYERLDGPTDAFVPSLLATSRTLALPVQVRLFDPSGLLASLRVTGLQQSGEFYNATTGSFVSGNESAALVDLGIGYRFPRNEGLVLLEVGNLLDSSFRFQELDPQVTTLAKRRTVFLKGYINF